MNLCFPNAMVKFCSNSFETWNIDILLQNFKIMNYVFVNTYLNQFTPKFQYYDLTIYASGVILWNFMTLIPSMYFGT